MNIDINPISIAISISAIIISMIALWHNYLEPFKLKITHTNPIFTIYEYGKPNNKGKGWWVPYFFIEISFFNSGKRPGLVKDIRILGELTSKTTKEMQKYPFYAERIVNQEIFEKYHRDRDQWIFNATKSNWHPIILPGKEMKQIHLVLETGGWDSMKIGTLMLSLEILSSNKKNWQKIKDYKLLLDKEMYSSYIRFELADLDYKRESFNFSGNTDRYETGVEGFSP